MVFAVAVDAEGLGGTEDEASEYKARAATISITKKCLKTGLAKVRLPTGQTSELLQGRWPLPVVMLRWDNPGKRNCVWRALNHIDIDVDLPGPPH